MSLLWSLVYVFNFIIHWFIFHKQLEHINSKKAKVMLLLGHHLNTFLVFEAKVVVLRFQMFTYYPQPQVPLMWYYLKIIHWHLDLDFYVIYQVLPLPSTTGLHFQLHLNLYFSPKTILYKWPREALVCAPILTDIYSVVSLRSCFTVFTF